MFLKKSIDGNELVDKIKDRKLSNKRKWNEEMNKDLQIDKEPTSTINQYLILH